MLLTVPCSIIESKYTDLSFSDTPSRGCIILFATYAETFGPSTVIISGKSPDITPALILSE